VSGTATVPVLEGNNWERFCVQALELRYGNAFQKVPAKFGGDYGLDGYLREETIFQFFGDQAGTSSAQRSKAQKAKLRDELPKLRKNEKEIACLVGSGVHEYVFLVSLLEDKSVIEYAGQREIDLLSWELSYLADDCRIVIKDIDYLQAEWERLYGAVREKLELSDPATGDEEIDQWVEGNDALITTLNEKLKVVVPEGHVPAWSRRMVRHRLEERDLMEQLRSKGPTWQRLREMKGDREDRLEERAFAVHPYSDLRDLCDTYRGDIQQEVTSLHYRDAHSLAWGAAADWLMRCPLRYGG
jgi:hypothetical protein